LSIIDTVNDSELYAGKEFHNFFPVSLGRLRFTGYGQDTFGSDEITARITRLTMGREVESERWQGAFNNLSAEITGSQDPDGYVRRMRDRVMHVLGPPVPRQSTGRK
jgi:hypothetical protein